jgi:hypothetical protein
MVSRRGEISEGLFEAIWRAIDQDGLVAGTLKSLSRR